MLISVLALTAAVAVSSPAPTPPPNQAVTYTYTTMLDPTADYTTVRKFNVDYGTLTLTFSPGKTILGTYKPDFSSASNVTGAVTGTGDLWLQIGGRRFSGQFTSRGIAVSAPASSGSRWGLWGQFVHA